MYTLHAAARFYGALNFGQLYDGRASLFSTNFPGARALLAQHFACWVAVPVEQQLPYDASLLLRAANVACRLAC